MTVPLEPTRVLIIDDDPSDREICKRYIQTAGGKFLFCDESSGASGLQACDSFTPDCVLLDYSLPDMDGLTVLRHLKSDTTTLKHPVVMLTAIGSEQTAVEAMKLGLMDYLVKNPANMDLLPRTIENAIRKFRMEEEIALRRAELHKRNRELELAQEDLLLEKEKYRSLTEAIPQLVWTASSSQLVQFANNRLLEYSGHSSNSSWPFSSLVYPDDLDGFREAWSAAAASGGIFETEIRLRRALDNTFRWHLVRAVPVLTINGKLDNWFGTCTDIENQRRAEESAREQQKLESIGLLAGGIAHDFNNLLVGIMGGASFAIQTLDNDHPAYPMLDMVVKASERAAHLTQQLLAYAGKSQAFLEPVNISKMLRETCDLLHASISKQVTLEFQLDPDVPEIEANSGQLQQLIMNLIINAAEAIGENAGKVRARTFVHEVQEGEEYRNALGYTINPGRYIGLEVVDSGCGMDSQTRAKIFEPFFTTKFTGRGLGLAAVQGIVRSLHGLIEVVSAPGMGTEFRVLLPARATKSARSMEPPAAGLPEPARILIIDDEEVVRRTFRAVLQQAGYTVLIANGGKSGVEIYRKDHAEIDLVLLDMSMPGKPGVQILQEIRSIDPEVPVAIASGYSEQEVARQFDTVSISGFVQKPFTSDRLLKKTAAILNECRARKVRGASSS